MCEEVKMMWGRRMTTMWTRRWLGESEGLSLEEALRKREGRGWGEVGVPVEPSLVLADLTQRPAGP